MTSINKLNKTNQNKKVEKAFLAQAAKLISDEAWYDVDWNIVLNMFMFGDLLEDVPRLMRSQSFGDPDYPFNVYRTFELAYDIDAKRTLDMIVYILKDIGVKEETINEYPAIKAILKNREIEDLSQLFPEISYTLIETKYLDIAEYPDDFYKDLVALINKCYIYGIYPVVYVFSRKLLENLLIDILRKKYGMKNIELFFDTKHRRHHSFNVLMKNFVDKIEDFKIIIPSLDHNFINTINKFRESGNSAAHTLEMSVKKEEIDDVRDDLMFVIKTLVRLWKNIT